MAHNNAMACNDGCMERMCWRELISGFCSVDTRPGGVRFVKMSRHLYYYQYFREKKNKKKKKNKRRDRKKVGRIGATLRQLPTGNRDNKTCVNFLLIRVERPLFCPRPRTHTREQHLLTRELFGNVKRSQKRDDNNEAY